MITVENITVKDIIEITGGNLLCGDETKEIKEFSIDSREGNEDSIFVPIIGERVDAHRFIESALKINGATFTQEHDAMEDDKPWIKVDDTVKAMQQVGTYYRRQMNLPVVAVTGSVGKTTTREMIAQALSAGLRVFQTMGNQNSQIGVPLTLSHLSKTDEVAVLEIGMSERGQIETLTNMICPDIAVVTVIGVSHIAQLKTQENICLEKMDIIKGLPENGKVFLNGDDPFLKKYKDSLDFTLFYYGLGENCDYRAKNIRTKDNKTCFTFCYEGGNMEVTLGVMGEHNVRNALAALGIAHQMNLDLSAVSEALSHFSGQRQQMIVSKRCRIIDDTYNASPDSMRAAIKVLCSMEEIQGRRVAALADMLELGSKEKEYHFEVGQFIGSQKVDEVAVYGELAREIIRGIEEQNSSIITRWFETREELGEYLRQTLKPEDVVLLKGSNGMKLKEITNLLSEGE